MDIQIAITRSGHLHAVSTVQSEVDAERFEATMQRQGYQVTRLSGAEAAARFARPVRPSLSQAPLLSKSPRLPWSALTGLPVTLVESEHVCGGEFNLLPWHRGAQDLALRVDARRSFAASVLFGRELNPSAQHWIAKHQEWLKAQAEIKAYAENEARWAEATRAALLAKAPAVGTQVRYRWQEQPLTGTVVAVLRFPADHPHCPDRVALHVRSPGLETCLDVDAFEVIEPEAAPEVPPIPPRPRAPDGWVQPGLW